MVGLAAVVNLMPCAPAPTVLLWCCAVGTHQPVEKLSAPNQGADPIGGDQPNMPDGDPMNTLSSQEGEFTGACVQIVETYNRNTLPM